RRWPPRCFSPPENRVFCHRLLTDGAAVRRYGVELDTYRSEEARKSMDEVVQGSAFDTYAAVESFSLVYLNPPYDFEIGEGRNQRMEGGR
ncbi:MAG: DUF6094 domain-containing protein, partial [Acidobacteria bacterium]|nr:DUF6094 domain-containing protein [Acidobacteriota bacterium]